MVTACVFWASCTKAPWASPDRLYLVQACVDGTLQSLERAMPMVWPTTSTAFLESAEFFVACVAGSSCDGVDACLTDLASGPPPFAYCQEDGCAAIDASSVSCDGTTATIARPDCTSLARDCARSSATCDATSPTGCTDRPLSRCETSAMGAPDRCDGDVRLGCDATGYVSWRDCAFLQGGTCTTKNGVADCDFGGGDCGAREVTAPSCNGHELAICAYGKNVSITSSDACP